MTELVERIGLPMFIQIIIELWNEIFIIILISILLIEKWHDIKYESGVANDVPFTKELFIFYVLLFEYNIFDVITIAFAGKQTLASYIIMRVGVFCYFSTEGVRTFFLLQLLKKRIVQRLSIKKLERIICVFQFLQIMLFIMLAATPFTDLLYKISADNVYTHSRGYIVWQNMTLLSFSFIGIVIISQWNNIEMFAKKIIVSAVFVPIIGIIGDLYLQLSMSNIMMTVSAIIIFIIYEKNKTKVVIKNIKELSETKTLLAESRLSLEQNKNHVLMAQIQPHFINNSLMALRARCVEYPDIYESITNFSLYLRSHFEALGDIKTISFEQEMTNIEAYLALEQENYKDNLKVEYNIECDDFMIPALSVQPLVENAVRHGIGTYEQGGTVYINTYHKDGKIIIEVIDDGSGRNNISPQQKKRKGIGIANVEARINSMTNGSLDIMKNENGTTARITLEGE